MSDGYFVEIAQSIVSSIMSVRVSLVGTSHAHIPPMKPRPLMDLCTEEVSLKSIGCPRWKARWIPASNSWHRRL